jgi:hypothetical protein
LIEERERPRASSLDGLVDVGLWKPYNAARAIRQLAGHFHEQEPL